MKTTRIGACLALLAIAGAPALHAQVGTNQGLLNPNLASEEELAAVPGLAGAVEALVAARPHLSMAGLDALLAEHLDEGARAAVYDRVWLPIDLNAATREEILLIPRVGDRMLGEFLEYRPYRALAEFRREIGKYVDDEELARLEQYVFVPIDLNTASDEDILSIPGVGERMLHEFKEYRPYRAMAQFDREIGKYVDEGEVARLRRYVRIQGS